MRPPGRGPKCDCQAVGRDATTVRRVGSKMRPLHRIAIRGVGANAYQGKGRRRLRSSHSGLRIADLLERPLLGWVVLAARRICMPSNFASSFAIAVIWERLLYCLRVQVMTVVLRKARPSSRCVRGDPVGARVLPVAVVFDTQVAVFPIEVAFDETPPGNNLLRSRQIQTVIWVTGREGQLPGCREAKGTSPSAFPPAMPNSAGCGAARAKRSSCHGSSRSYRRMPAASWGRRAAFF